MAILAEQLTGFRKRYAEKHGAWPEIGDPDDGSTLPKLTEMFADEIDFLRELVVPLEG